ncbi:CocE/NonD family hydrolase [Oceanobacillus saliphilus]|uniref:CocE/NonD family hydrolase n=1 Tax=Oceanobacillus saliphilus TaxID=2925834 RepID=UPI00201E4661|nr:CocE/NonD family hydrolase [Oceanobacillus saliphilus]
MKESKNNVQIIVDREVACTLRDGTNLYATIYRPSGEGEYPVLLTRLPYDKNLPNFSHRYIDPIRFAMNGYVVIIQDVRGRFASEGEFEPFVQELKDGYDTVEWAASLPYANGNVGMFGLSYYAFTQLYALMEQPPSLKAIFPAMTGHIFSDAFTQNGVNMLASTETWVLDSVAADYLKRKQSTEQYAETIKEITNDLDHIDEWHSFKPVKDWPPIKKHPELVDFFKKYVNQEFTEQARKQFNSKVAPSELGVPAYHLAGWYDNFLNQTIQNFEAMKGSVNNQKLIIGPWGHGMFDSELGERSFGKNSSGNSIDGKEDITGLHIKWFDYWLKTKHEQLPEEESPVKIFIMGENKWRSEKTWPLERTVYTPYYLREDGMLSEAVPGDEAADSYVHDPGNPVPTHGGGVLFYNGRGAGPYDQREIEKRNDVLTYTSEVLDEAVEVTGWIKMKLWAAYDAKDTDFVVKLIDVLPDGTAYNLTDGVIRTNNRYDNPGKNDATDANEVVALDVDMWATSNVFLPGHAIRIEISSSSFPRFDVNPGTGNTLMDTTEMVKSNQKIYHDHDHPSHIILPIIPR